MNANDLAKKYKTSPIVQGHLEAGQFVRAIRAIHEQEGNSCNLVTAKEAVDIIRGQEPRLFTASEVRELIVRNAIGRLTLTEVEREAFKEKGLL